VCAVDNSDDSRVFQLVAKLVVQWVLWTEYEKDEKKVGKKVCLLVVPMDEQSVE
jgi:hypothetical protein